MNIRYLIEAIVFMAIIIAIGTLALLKLRSRKTKITFANIGEGTRETGHWAGIWDSSTASALASSLAANTASQGRFLLVKKSTDGDHITTCGAGDVSVGVVEDAYDAVNPDVPVSVALHGAGKGTHRVVTDGTIADGAPMKAGASGQATAATTGDAGIFGRACFGSDTSSAAGDIITFVSAVPFKYAF